MAVSSALLRPRTQSTVVNERNTSTSGRGIGLTQSDRVAAVLPLQRLSHDAAGKPFSSLPRSSSRRNLQVCNSLGGNMGRLMAKEAQYAKAVPVPLQADDVVAQLERKIKLAAQWQDIEDLVSEVAQSPRPAHLAACCLHRLGCQFVYASDYTKEQLNASSLVKNLEALLVEGIPSLSAGDILAAFDGYARLQYPGSHAVLKPMAAFLPQHCPAISAQQLPPLLWAMGVLRLRPQPAVLNAVSRELIFKSAGFTSQGITLTLWACGRLAWHPGHSVLSALSDAVRRNLGSFKNDELAACLQAFSAFNHTPSNQLMQAVADRAGKPWTAPARPSTPARRALEAAALSSKQAGMHANAALAASLKRLKKQYQDSKMQAAQAVQAARVRALQTNLVAAHKAHLKADCEPWTNMGAL